MRLHYSIVVLTTGLACALGGQLAWADMYKLINEEGGVTFSNTPPKDRTRIIEVFPSSEWSRPTAPVAPAVATQQMEELRVLADRVELLSRLLEDERRFDAAQPVAYPQYTTSAPPMWNDGWGYSGGWNGGWFGPPFFASPVVVVGGTHRLHQPHKFHHFPRSNHLHGGGIRSHPNAAIGAGGGARSQGAGGGTRFQGDRGGGRMR